jgi:HD-GYP domain-containing protein (c-di-GMP phosphodiesterase class II)
MAPFWKRRSTASTPSQSEKLIDSHLVRPGVFVARLDRPWTETPFLLQGFLVRTQDEANDLRQYCKYVYIDTQRGADVGDIAPPPEPEAPEVYGHVTPGRAQGEAAVGPAVRQAAEEPRHIIGPYPVSMEEEVHRALDLHKNTRAIVNNILEDARLGKSIDSPAAKAVVAELAESILRNPDALTFLTQLRAKDEYLIFHSLNVCVFSLVFGRHLNFSVDDLRVLGLGGLLHDVGYVKLPTDLLNKPGELTPEEFRQMKGHVEEGISILRKAQGIPGTVLEGVRDHHERLDGSGYPQGLQGQEISLYGMATAILDTYDALTTDRPWRPGVTPAEALRRLYEGRQRKFHEGLVLQFIQCIGIYPVGSLVVLSTGDTGAVVASDPRYRLQPKVRLIFDRDGHRYDTPVMVDLLHQQVSAGVSPITIKSTLHPAECGLSMTEVAELALPPS